MKGHGWGDETDYLSESESSQSEDSNKRKIEKIKDESTGTPSSLADHRILIKKAKLFHFFGTELESKTKIKSYIQSTVINIRFTKDAEGRDLIATAKNRPFKTTRFEMTMESSIGNGGSKLCQVTDAPMFCSYSSKYKGRSFVMSVKAGLVRDERILEIHKKDRFLKIAQAVYIPPDSYVKERLNKESMP
jgi:hypothetical protein